MLLLIFNVFFQAAGKHKNQDILSYKLFHQSCLLIFISFGLYIYLAITDDFPLATLQIIQTLNFQYSIKLLRYGVRMKDQCFYG